MKINLDCEIDLKLIEKIHNINFYSDDNVKMDKGEIMIFFYRALYINSVFTNKNYISEVINHEFFRKIKDVNQLKEYQLSRQYDEYYVYNKESFQERFKFFDFNYYKDKYYPKVDMSDNELISDYMLNGIKNKCLYSKKIFFVFYVPELTYTIGGIVAIYNMVRLINKQNNPNYCAKIFNMENKKFDSEFNSIDDFITLQEINDNCIVFYPETITGNPLNSKNTVRWILLKLGIETKRAITKSWDKNDYIVHWESSDKSRNLRYHYIKKSFFNEKISNRTWTCCLVKKGRLTHSNINTTSYDLILDDILNEPLSIKYLFSNKYSKLMNINILGRDYFKKIRLLTIKKNSWHNNDIDDIIAFYFNRCKLFFTYDIKTMWIVYSLLCGCPVVIIPYKKISKEDFFNESIFNFKGKILNDGIAWGYDEIEFAKKTIDNASDNIFKIFNSEENIALEMIDSIYNKFKLKREKEEYEIENFTSKKFDDIVKKINLIYPKLKIKNDKELEYFFENMEEDNIIEIKKEYLNIIK